MSIFWLNKLHRLVERVRIVFDCVADDESSQEGAESHPAPKKIKIVSRNDIIDMLAQAMRETANVEEKKAKLETKIATAAADSIVPKERSQKAIQKLGEEKAELESQTKTDHEEIRVLKEEHKDLVQKALQSKLELKQMKNAKERAK
ncbi:hypothetical protein N0V95_001783 [Ascochyta clinopodiicola]|nr:hypothetical protein N0V95_001783 [Ascochyta clinopodiicola]